MRLAFAVVWAVGLSGCSGDDGSVKTETDTPATEDTGLTETGTTSDTASASSVVLEGSPLIVLVGEQAPLTALLSLQTAEPTFLTVTMHDGERQWSHRFPEAVTAHEVPLVGGRALHTVEVTASLEPEGGGVPLVVEAGSYALGPLPLGLDQVGAVSTPSAMEPGFTLLTLAGYLAMLDDGGEIVWLAEARGSVHEVLFTREGAIRYGSGRSHFREMDLAGNQVGGYHAAQTNTDPETTPVDALVLHHDMQELPDGTLLTLSAERRWQDYPTSEVDPTAPLAEAWVVGDTLLHLDPSGAILDQWPLLDRLDPLRIGYDSVLGGWWNDFDPWEPDDNNDWSHANAVTYDAARDYVIVGLRHQDAVVAIERVSGEVAWVLAPPANWSGPVADKVLAPDASVSLLPYHMHAARWTDADTLSLFDNGNGRASAYEPVIDRSLEFARAVEYRIDEAAGTFSEVWSYGLEEEILSGSLGDVDVLPTTDNVLITWGNVRADARGTVRVQEVTRDGTTVFDLWLPLGTLFRAQRVPSLYP